MATDPNIIFTDHSRLVVEALVQAGADVFAGYPITPANLFYANSTKRFPSFMAAPDEITTLQWMSGFSATGKLPVTATSFPGYALMLEGINMAYMMELPMIIILVQRLGPATGTATCGAQGDLALLNGTISGGLSLPVFSMSNASDCWEIPVKAVETAVSLRAPVIILTSKEEVMTQGSFDINSLKEITKVKRNVYDSRDKFIPYLADNRLVPGFLPLGNTAHQVRLTASTHDTNGIIQNTSQVALDNSKRLHDKAVKNLSEYTFFEYDKEENAISIVVSYGVSAQAAREAVSKLRAEGEKVSLLILKTLLPVPHEYYKILSGYKHIVIAEENYTGQYRQILFGAIPPENIKGVNEFGKMITPESIIKEIKEYEQAIPY